MCNLKHQKIIICVNKLLKFVFVLSITSLLTNYNQAYCQKENLYGKTAFNMLTLLEKNHFSPQQIDDELSKKVWLKFINYLDPYHFVFLDNDIAAFSEFKTSLCKETMNQRSDFLSKVTSVYEKRLNETDSLINVICSTAPNFNEKDYIIYYFNDTLSYPKNRDEQKRRWVKYIKHRELKLMIGEGKEYSDNQIDSLLKKEPVFREKVKKSQKRFFQRMLLHPSGYESVIASIYMNAFATCFDPHTFFFTPNDKKNFESAISPNSLSFGFTIKETTDYEIEIASLIPGGPAWKSNLIHTGDVLLELKWGDKKPIDLTGASEEEVYLMLNESNTDKLTLKIRMSNELVEEVVLTKEKIKSEENLVRGIILSGEKKIGYISLPGFYTEWNNQNDPGCANDVAKEVIKLKQNGIDGLILDIRSNGGGSMTEALNLAGIFIDEGPLGIYYSRGAKPVTMKDMNRGTIYDGPLVVMVNAGSASASEFISGSLQDYNRALIIGNPTYGKGSGQIVLPNDTATNVANNIFPNSDPKYGYVITTTFKFYRVKGNSNQLTGVIPDIALPDFYRTNNDREISNKNALSNDSVVKKVYLTTLPSLPVTQLAVLSKKRCENNVFIKQMGTFLDSLNSCLDIKKIPLDINSYIKLKRKIYNFTNAIDTLETSYNNNVKLINYEQNKEIFKIDDYNREMNKQFTESLEKDALLDEAYNIISDLINFMKQK
ncbi:MAG: PDZ domain-containing protein [Bacteroidia bacterium]|nr:PDZ domain-containing protein [Bacteroidia bacterium]